MKIIILKNLNEIGKVASSIIEKEIKKKPGLILGLASGKTVIPLYKNLVSRCKKGKINFSRVKTFNLDEYLVPAQNKNSLRHFMDIHLFNKINLKKEDIDFLDGSKKNTNKECRKYEYKIKKSPIDLQVLGIGKNAHIGFNEPGSSFNSGTRKVRLSKETLKERKASKFALTMGMKTIMKAKKIILLASGKEKAVAVKNSIEGRISAKIPASILQKHKNAVFIMDKAAASKLKAIKFK